MCTGIRFTDTHGHMFFGRNLDWGCGYGQQIFVTPRNYQRPYAFDGPARGGYALIGIAVEGEGIPLYFDCASEKGLAVAGLNFPGEGFAQYEKAPVEGKTNIAAYEFPLWVAHDNDQASHQRTYHNNDQHNPNSGGHGIRPPRARCICICPPVYACLSPVRQMRPHICTIRRTKRPPPASSGGQRN